MNLLKKIIKSAFKPIINKAKGAIGEQRVSAKLNPLLFGKVEHRQINNLVLIDENGKSHQIDHIEIRQNGIFCIETKNYSGWIFGNEEQQMWTQTFYNEKHQFLNPIRQNRSHIYHISKILGGKYKINSVIVMVQNNADRINVPYVVNLNCLKSYLSSFYDGTHYSILEMDYIYRELLSASRCDITSREHIENIKITQNEIQNNICPRCKGKLILKKGKYGNFYGCSNYPNCKFTKKL
ncbi:MAG: NERD domain-containing protein [Clostridia bacterium]|nr:NERD domain-containing protein [Clostridia bacterium]